jgi:hypothetical protein
MNCEVEKLRTGEELQGQSECWKGWNGVIRKKNVANRVLERLEAKNY